MYEGVNVWIEEVHGVHSRYVVSMDHACRVELPHVKSIAVVILRGEGEVVEDQCSASIQQS